MIVFSNLLHKGQGARPTTPVVEATLQFMASNNEIQAEALEPFREDKGTIYPTVQAELDFHQAYKFHLRNRGPFIEPLQASTALMQHNSPGRLIRAEEQAAIKRLLDLVLDVEDGYKWGPDVAIKCFADLDLVFFGGHLSGNVVVKWASCEKDRRLRIFHSNKSYGLTEYRLFREKGQTRIVLNTDALLTDGRCLLSFRMMFSTLLHEMCHAYDLVVCPRPWLLMGWEDAHGEHFCLRLTAVHRRAERLLGLCAIDEWEPYDRHHYFADEHGGGYLTCSGGLAVQQGIEAGTHRWSDAHVRSSRNGGRNREERKCVMM